MKKLFPAVISLLLAFSASGCFDETLLVQSASVTTSEISMTDETSQEKSEESALRESWTEQYRNESENITLQYLNYGEILIKTIEKFNFVDVMIAKDEYVLKNDIPIKKSFWEFRDDGSIINMSIDELKSNGSFERTVEHNDFDGDVYSYSKYIYSDESCEKLLSSSSLYKSISDGKRLIEKTFGISVSNGKDFSTETLIFYKDDILHHYAVTKTLLEDESAEYSILDSAKNNIITHCYSKDKKSQSIRCYREKGFIEVSITDTLLTYYESNDGATKILVGEVKINPETGKQHATNLNKDKYTANEANRIMRKYDELYNAAIEFKNDVDYSS